MPLRGSGVVGCSHTSRRWAASAAASTACLLAAVPVLAAQPAVNTRWDGRTAQAKGRLTFVVTVQHQAVLTAGTFRWRCHGRSAQRAYQPKATTGPVRGITIRKDGRFGGTARGVIIGAHGKPIGRASVGWSGRFRSGTRADGTIVFRGAGCRSPVVKWAARVRRRP
jgi:hypothetical protein